MLLLRHFQVLVLFEAGPKELFRLAGDYRRITALAFRLPGHVLAPAVSGNGIPGHAKSPRFFPLRKTLFNRHFPDMLVLVPPGHYPPFMLPSHLPDT